MSKLSAYVNKLIVAHDRLTARLFVPADYFCKPYRGNVKRWCCWRHVWNRNLDNWRCKIRSLKQGGAHNG